MGDILRHSLRKQLQFQEKKTVTMLTLHNVATAILLMVVHTLVSTHPNIPKADLQNREASAVGWQKAFEGGRCGGGNWLRGHDESTQSQCQEACSSEDDCEFYCHSSTPPAFHWECLRYNACPSLNTTLLGDDASSYSCYKKPGSYVQGNRGEDACPEGSEPITDLAECEEAAHYFQYKFDSEGGDKTGDLVCAYRKIGGKRKVQLSSAHFGIADWLCKDCDTKCGCEYNHEGTEDYKCGTYTAGDKNIKESAQIEGWT